MTSRQSCPRCGKSVSSRALSCSGCGQSLLCGLVASALHDSGLVARAARVLASTVGGPGLGEARRRLTEGLPLIVGVSRADAEELQGRLLELGLIPRLGPAPEGTVPLQAPLQTSLRRAVWLGLAGGAVIVAILLALWPARIPRQAAPAVPERTTPVRLAPVAPRVGARQRSSPRVPAESTVPADRRLELWARVQFVGDGLQVEGWARAPTSDAPPEGPLTLIGQAAGAEVLSESLPESQARTRRDRGAEPAAPVTRTLPFRVSLTRERLGSATELVLEATWDAWRSEPLRLEIPEG